MNIRKFTNGNKKADSTLRCSQAVPHPSTNRALCRLTSEVRRDPVHSTRYGRQRHTLCIILMHHIISWRQWKLSATSPKPLNAEGCRDVARVERARCCYVLACFCSFSSVPRISNDGFRYNAHLRCVCMRGAAPRIPHLPRHTGLSQLNAKC